MNTDFKGYLVKAIKFYWVGIYLLDVCWWSEFLFFLTQIERKKNSYWRNVFRYCQVNLIWRAFRRRKKADSKKQETLFLSSLSLLSSCSYYICDCTCRYYVIKFYKKIEQLNTSQKNFRLKKNVLYSLLYFL